MAEPPRFARIPLAALLLGDPSAVLVLLALRSFAPTVDELSPGDERWPTQRELAERAGLSRQAVIRALGALEAAELVMRQGKTKQGSSYRFPMPPAPDWSRLATKPRARMVAPADQSGADRATNSGPEVDQFRPGGRPIPAAHLSREREEREGESAAHARDLWAPLWEALRRYPRQEGVRRRGEDAKDRAALHDVLQDIVDAFPDDAVAGIVRALDVWHQSKAWRENRRGEDVGVAQFAGSLAEWLRDRRYRERPPSIYRPGDPRHYASTTRLPDVEVFVSDYDPELDRQRAEAVSELEGLLPPDERAAMRNELNTARDRHTFEEGRKFWWGRVPTGAPSWPSGAAT